MANNLLKVEDRYANPYEQLYNQMKSNPRFNEEMYKIYYLSGNAPAFFTIQKDIIDMPDEKYQELSDEYRLDLYSSEDKLNFFMAQLYLDDVSVKNFTDENVDIYGQKNVIPFLGTEREHALNQYKQLTAQLVEKEKEEEEQRRKDEWHEANKSWDWIIGAVDPLADLFVKAPLETIGGFLDIFWSAGSEVAGWTRHEDFGEGYAEGSRQSMEYSPWHKLIDSVSEWQAAYSTLRDVRGNPTNGWFNAIISTANSFGRTLPSMAVGFIPVVGPVLSQVMYWSSMSQTEYEEMLNDPNFASTPSWKLMINSGLRTGVEFLVQEGLNQVFKSVSTWDTMAFHKKVNGKFSISGKGAIATVLWDAFHEGTEELLQQWSGYFINEMFGAWDESFLRNNHFTFEDMLNAFVLGAFGSIVGSMTSITKSFIDDRINKRDFHTLRNWQAKRYLKELDETIKQIEKGVKKGKISAKDGADLITSLGTAFRYTTDYMTQIGSTNTSRANDILNRISEYNVEKQKGRVNRAKYAEKLAADLGQLVEDVNEAMKDMKTSALDSQMIGQGYDKRGWLRRSINKIFNKNNITEVKEVVSVDTSLTAEDVEEDFRNIKKDIGKKAKNIGKKVGAKAVVVTKDGKGSDSITVETKSNESSVVSQKVLFIPEQELENRSEEQIIKELSEKGTVENVKNSSQYKAVRERIIDIYRKITNKGAGSDIDEDEVVTSLLLNDQFQEKLIGIANKDIIELLSLLNIMYETENGLDDYSASTKQVIEKSISKLKSKLFNYYSGNLYVRWEHLTIFNEDEKKQLQQKRSQVFDSVKDVYLGKGNGLDVIDQKINSLPISQEEKDKLKKRIRSSELSTRIRALVSIESYNRDLFFFTYDGHTYMPCTSLPNNVLNSYLKSVNIKVDNIREILIYSKLKSLFKLSKSSYNYFQKLGLSMMAEYEEIVNAINNDILVVTGTEIFVNLTYQNAVVSTMNVTENPVNTSYVSQSIEEGTYIPINKVNDVLVGITGNKNNVYSFTDIVTNGKVSLNEEINKIISEKYDGKFSNPAVRYEAINQYLRDTSYFLTMSQYGEVVLVDYKNYEELLIKSKKDTINLIRGNGDKKSKKFHLSDIIKKEYADVIGDPEIVVTFRTPEQRLKEIRKGFIRSGDYSYNEGRISIVLDEDQSYDEKNILGVIFHEFGHGIQTYTGLNKGAGYGIINYFYDEEVYENLLLDYIDYIRSTSSFAYFLPEDENQLKQYLDYLKRNPEKCPLFLREDKFDDKTGQFISFTVKDIIEEYEGNTTEAIKYIRERYVKMLNDAAYYELGGEILSRTDSEMPQVPFVIRIPFNSSIPSGSITAPWGTTYEFGNAAGNIGHSVGYGIYTNNYVPMYSLRTFDETEYLRSVYKNKGLSQVIDYIKQNDSKVSRESSFYKWTSDKKYIKSVIDRLKKGPIYYIAFADSTKDSSYIQVVPLIGKNVRDDINSVLKSYNGQNVTVIQGTFTYDQVAAYLGKGINRYLIVDGKALDGAQIITYSVEEGKTKLVSSVTLVGESNKTSSLDESIENRDKRIKDISNVGKDNDNKDNGVIESIHKNGKVQEMVDFLKTHDSPDFREGQAYNWLEDRKFADWKKEQISRQSVPFVALLSGTQYDGYIQVVPILGKDVQKDIDTVMSKYEGQTIVFVQGSFTYGQIAAYLGKDSEACLLIDSTAIKGSRLLKAEVKGGQVFNLSETQLFDQHSEVDETSENTNIVNEVLDQNQATEKTKYTIDTLFSKSPLADIDAGEQVSIGPNGKEAIDEIDRAEITDNTGIPNVITIQKTSGNSLTICVRQNATQQQIDTILTVVNLMQDTVEIKLVNAKRSRFYKFRVENGIDSNSFSKIFIANVSILRNPKHYSGKQHMTDIPKREVTGEDGKRRFVIDENADDAAKEDHRKLLREKFNTQRRTSYISNKDAKGTNFEYYIKKGRPIMLHESLQDLILEADSLKLEPDLWKQIENGTLSDINDVKRYFKDHISTMNDYTFELIARTIYHNTTIKTYSQLSNLTENSLYYYILGRLNAESQSGYIAGLTLTPEEAVEHINKLPKKKYEEKVNKYQNTYANLKNYDGEDVEINPNDMNILFMLIYDGTVWSAYAAISKAINEERHKVSQRQKGTVKTETAVQDRHGETYVKEEGQADISGRQSDDSGEDALIDTISDLSVNELQKRLLKITMQSAMDKVRKHMKQEGRDYYNEKEKQYLLKAQDKNLEIIQNMSEAKLIHYYKKYIDNEASKVETTEEQITEESTETEDVIAEERKSYSERTNLRSNIKRRGTMIESIMRSKDVKRFLEKNGDIFEQTGTDKKDAGVKIKRDAYEGKSIEELQKLNSRLKELYLAVNSGAYKTKVAIKSFEQLQKRNKKLREEIERKDEEIAKLREEARKKNDRVHKKVFVVGNTHIEVQSDTKMPETLEKIFETNFENFAKTDVKYLSTEDEYHMKMSYKEFLEQNADRLQSMDENDMREILEYLKGDHVTLQDDDIIRTKYYVFRMYVLGYMLSKFRSGTIDLTESEVDDIKYVLKSSASLAGSVLSAFSQIVDDINPAKYIIKAMSVRLGITLSDEDAELLLGAAKSRNAQEIKLVREQLTRKYIENYEGPKNKLWDRLISIQRVAMLSSPQTIIRNQVSNSIIRWANKATSWVGRTLTKRSKRSNLLENQYVIVGTNVDEETKTWVKKVFIDSGLFDELQDGLSKVDSQRIRTYKNGNNVFANVMMQRIISDIYSQSIWAVKADEKGASVKAKNFMNKWNDIVLHLLSDNRFIRKATQEYFEKMIVERQQDLNRPKNEQRFTEKYDIDLRDDKGLLRNKPTIDQLNMFAEAFILASNDYMRKGSFWSDLERSIRKRLGNAGYFAYKQLFPFANASWNWACEALKYTPFGLLNSIKNWFRLEQYADRLDQRRKAGEKNVVSSEFSTFMVSRDIGKGVLGSIGTVIGALLVLAGAIKIDDKDDDKLKLDIKGFKVDISPLFASCSILVGATLTNAILDKDNAEGVISKVFDNLFNDFLVTDLFNSFRNAGSVGEWFLEQPTDMLAKFIPSFWKQFSQIVGSYNQRAYDGGWLGDWEYLSTQLIPGITYAFPTRIDPYTGKAQSKYIIPFVFDIVNKFLPVKIAMYKVSAMEKEAISYGAFHGELTGNYNELKENGVKMTKKQLNELNEFYGKLNEKTLSEVKNSNTKYKVEMEDGTYKELTYDSMSDKQRKSVINRIMANNASTAKIYIMTKYFGYSYYTSSDKVKEYKNLGISSVYIKTDKKSGLIK